MLPPAARTLAAVQGGALSRAQLHGLGVSRRVVERLTAEAVLHRLTPGIYSHGPSVSWAGSAWAGLLLGGSGAVLGLDTAAHLWGLAKEPPSEITVYAPTGRAARPGWRFLEAQRSGVGEPTRTPLDDTLLDLCAHGDEDSITALLADALSGRRTTVERLRRAVAQRRNLKHRGVIREILGDVSTGAHSPLERRFLIDVERAHALPTAQRQQRAVEGHRSDVWYEEFALLVELDGKLHHSGAAVFRDMSRDNDHALSGMLTLRLGWMHVTGTAACETSRMLAQALMARGWEGPAQPCGHCSRVHPV